MGMTTNNVTVRSRRFAESALGRKIGARGLRMIIEESILDVMYSLPHQKKLRECVITRKIVEANDQRLSLLEKAGEERGEPHPYIEHGRLRNLTHRSAA
jgi:ATP-dependent protease Clp ATPase subunit